MKMRIFDRLSNYTKYAVERYKHTTLKMKIVLGFLSSQCEHCFLSMRLLLVPFFF